MKYQANIKINKESEAKLESTKNNETIKDKKHVISDDELYAMMNNSQYDGGAY